ncbi:rhomboid family intramembrane serine protease [Endozoicomonas numazuensis]|uniref:Peptidase S54 rhomboid domain-containing protein n=1 Tax=Endozoicomonas numazuensis TaxID=1137799 RepID=A0A081NDZ4_9GAMM|nr:rhomboid family intramembrane serine protease [Endozoicomonas numazuensis]KEQ16667.1 hypothetical protein GZ78_18295 [Endozoicomonas numazuensis]
MYRALELPAHKDLSALSYFLYRQGVPHRITEESGKQVLWTQNEQQGEAVEQFYQDWLSGELELEVAPPRKGPEVGSFFKSIPWKRFPFTFLILAVCLVVAVLTHLGENIQAISCFTFVDFKVSNGYLYFASLGYTLDSHEYWRLITPIFIHFGILHLVFNALMFYVLGGRIEMHQGGIHLLGLVMLTGVLSNFAQYAMSDGSVLFGGLSGVVYGLMGYSMVRERLDKSFYMGLPPAIYGFMIVWLVIGYTDILGSVLGQMANAAHLGGLVSGVVLGGLAALMFKSRIKI